MIDKNPKLSLARIVRSIGNVERSIQQYSFTRMHSFDVCAVENTISKKFRRYSWVFIIITRMLYDAIPNCV